MAEKRPSPPDPVEGSDPLPATPEVQKKAEVIHILPRALLDLADSARTIHYVLVPEGTPRNAVLKPEFWSLCATKLRIGGRIECMWEDGTYYTELMVRFVGQNTAVVQPLFEHELEPINVVPVADYEAAFRGTSWVVIRKSDNQVVASGLATQSAALAWAEAHQTALRR